MRKASIFIIIAALAVLLIACSQQSDEPGADESPTSTSSFSVGETEGTPASSEEPAVTESATPQPAESEPTSTPTPSDKPPSVPEGQPNGGQSMPTPKAETQPPAATPKPTEEPADPPKASEPPVQSEPPATQTPTEPPKAFEAQPYVDYAISYGQSIGLIYEPRIGTGAWNAPVNLYAALSDESMKQGVRSSCDILVSEGFEYFYPLAAKQVDGSYKLYVYYG